MIKQTINHFKEITKGLFIGVCFLMLYTFYGYLHPASYSLSHVPFSNTYTIDLTEQVRPNQEDYMELAQLLGSLSESDTVIFKLHSFGGDVAAMQILINAMDTTKAHTIADVVGASYSAGAVITCHAKEINMYPNSYLMFHNARTNQGILPPGPFRTALNRSLQACVPHSILNQEQITMMNNAVDDVEIYWYPLSDKVN